MGAGGSRDGRSDRAGGSDPWAAARAAMLASQLRGRGIADPAVLAAMAAVPREAFVREADRARAYGDFALPIDRGQSISQPYIVARMVELLRVRPGMRILEVGTGSGYQAAVLAAMGATVLTVERHRDLAERARARLAAVAAGLPAGSGAIEVRVGDGSLGVPDGAPWDGIVVAAGAPAIPMPLREQLAIGARLVIPVGSAWQQDLRVVERRGPNDWEERSDGPCVFVPLLGAGGHRR
jgi:protein-L-isoaspartate(D-aspartate) O-methyltransferase